MSDQQPTEHYRLTVDIDGDVIDDHPIADPFVTTTITIARRDLLRSLLRRRRMVVRVRVDGDRHAVFHVIQEVRILPPLEQRTPAGAYTTDRA